LDETTWRLEAYCTALLHAHAEIAVGKNAGSPRGRHRRGLSFSESLRILSPLINPYWEETSKRVARVLHIASMSCRAFRPDLIVSACLIARSLLLAEPTGGRSSSACLSLLIGRISDAFDNPMFEPAELSSAVEAIMRAYAASDAILKNNLLSFALNAALRNVEGQRGCSSIVARTLALMIAADAVDFASRGRVAVAVTMTRRPEDSLEWSAEPPLCRLEQLLECASKTRVGDGFLFKYPPCNDVIGFVLARNVLPGNMPTAADAIGEEEYTRRIIAYRAVQSQVARVAALRGQPGVYRISTSPRDRREPCRIRCSSCLCAIPAASQAGRVGPLAGYCREPTNCSLATSQRSSTWRSQC